MESFKPLVLVKGKIFKERMKTYNQKLGINDPGPGIPMQTASQADYFECFYSY